LVNNSRVLVSNSRLIWSRPKWWGKKQVEDWNEPNLMALQDCDDGIDLSSYDFDHDNLGLIPDATNKQKLAYRHRFVGDLYSKGLEKLLNHEQMMEWQLLYEATDRYTDGWLSAGMVYPSVP
jgi:hypothetical protein